MCIDEYLAHRPDFYHCIFYLLRRFLSVYFLFVVLIVALLLKKNYTEPKKYVYFFELINHERSR